MSSLCEQQHAMHGLALGDGQSHKHQQQAKQQQVNHEQAATSQPELQAEVLRMRTSEAAKTAMRNHQNTSWQERLHQG